MFRGIFRGRARYRRWLELGQESYGEFFEAVIAKTYASVVQEGDWVLDCGANQGRHTRPLCDLVGLTGRVIAFEPIPIHADALAAVRGTPQLHVVRKAVGREEQPARFQWVQADDGGYSGLRQSSWIPVRDRQCAVSIGVQVATIDIELAGRDHSVSFVKMDLEGGEYHALLGAANLIVADRPFIIFENTGPLAAHTYDYTETDFFAFFRSVDYLVFDLFGRPLDRRAWRTLGSFSISADHQPSVGTGGYPWYSIAVCRRSLWAQQMKRRMLAILNDLPVTAMYRWPGPGWQDTAAVD